MSISDFFSHEKTPKYSNAELFIALVLVIATFLVPPMMLGLKGTSLALLILFLNLILFIYLKKNSSLSMTFESLIILAFVCVYFLYLHLQSAAISDAVPTDYLKAFISISVFIVIFGVCFTIESIKWLYFKIFIGVLIFFSISNIFTLIASFFIGSESLLLYELQLFEDTYKLQIFFPITVSYGRMSLFGEIIMRLSALFREPGIAQAFYLWAFVVCSRYYSSGYVKVLLVLGALMTLSTTAFVGLALIYFLQLILEKRGFKKTFFIIFMIPIAFFVYETVPGLSLESKNSESYDARVTKLDESLGALDTHLFFGIGSLNSIEGTSTSLLQQTYAIGIVGVSLYLLIFVAAFFLSKKQKKLYLISIAPILLTLLLSQPIYHTPIVFAFLLSDHDY